MDVRNSHLMFQMILDFAREDSRVRAVYLNGSRANPNAPVDPYQDFDIVYLVTELDSFLADDSWIDRFGPRLILQTPEAMRNPLGIGHFNWMMLFADGNRLDLTLIPLDKQELISDDSATVVLLDKDGLLPSFPPASDRDYWVKAPSELDYFSSCNNFFWCMQNVAKGIVREEIPYAMSMYHELLDTDFHDMAAWYIGTKTGFQVSAGKRGKYFKRYFSPTLYEHYKRIFCRCEEPDFWRGIREACSLFRFLALQVGKAMGYPYPSQDDQGIMLYLKKMQNREW